MATGIFWACAAVVVVSALAVVGQTRPARAFTASPVLVAGIAALCLLLSAPVVAAALVILAFALLAAGWWVAATLAPSAESASGRVVPARSAGRLGVALVVVFVLELAWVFRRVRGAGLPAADAPSASLSNPPVAVDSLLLALLAGLLLLAIVVGVRSLPQGDVS